MEAITTRKITRQITESEIVATAKTLATLMSEREQIILEKKSVVGEFKAKIEEKDEVIHHLQNSINSGTIQETLQCLVRKNYTDRVKEFICDGEIVDTEPLSESDLQMDL